jgi:hypothetical protein
MLETFGTEFIVKISKLLVISSYKQNLTNVKHLLVDFLALQNSSFSTRLFNYLEDDTSSERRQ